MKAEGDPLRVLLTGATGFLGKYVARELKGADAEVIETSKTIGYDLRNESEALTCVWLARPDVVVHLAKSPLHPREAGAFSFRDTMSMGLNVIHAATLARAKVVLVVPPDLHEEDTKNGEAAAKKALLGACKAYQDQFGTEVRVLMLSELYGPFQKAQDAYLDPLTLINTFTLARLKGETTVILPGTGEERRRLLAVPDAAKAVRALTTIDSVDDMVVMSGKEVITEKTLAEGVWKACKFEGVLEWDGETGPFNPPTVIGDGNSKAILGVEAITPMEQVLNTMVAIRMESLPVMGGEHKS